ncbi:MAG: hypothetical protein QM605_10605 [Sphingobium sp.]
MAHDFDAVHAELRRIMLATSKDFIVSRDEPGDLIVRTPTIDPGTKEQGWFGTVTKKKSYVAYHLIPLYAHPDLAAGISPALAKRRQGKTCFNFKSVDPVLFAELDDLTRKSAARA